MGNFFKEILFTPFYEMQGYQIIFLAIFGVLAVILSIKVAKALAVVLKAIWVVLKDLFSVKGKCKKIQCRHCGRTLDKCICERNRGAGNIKKLYRYKKETREIRLRRRNS